MANRIIDLKEAGNFYCLHPTFRNFDLKGSWLLSEDYNVYDIWLTSCSSRFVLFDGTESGAEEDCVWDLSSV